MGDATEDDVATAFAPATVGNVAVGFDILGFALASPGDRVEVTRIDESTVRIAEITGVVTDLPTDATENTATAGLVELIDDLNLDFGFEVRIEKGIPLGSGMGGSAASAVASIVAADSLINRRLSRPELLHYALLGEAVATGEIHADNVTPCLFGGLTLTRSIDPVDIIEIPVPEQIRCAVVYPHRRVDTKRARQAIPDELPVAQFVEQSANLAGFIAGCYRGDLDLIGRSLEDVLIEAHRAPLVPGLTAVRRAADEAGVLGSSISGAGPTVFAWCRSAKSADLAAQQMADAFVAEGCDTSVWTGAISVNGAHLVEGLNRSTHFEGQIR